jgi:hypothetical protein
MSKEEEKPRPRKLMAYLGMREGEKRKLLHAYVDVGDDWQTREFPLVPLPALDDGLHLYGKRLGFARPGVVISIEHEMEEEGTVYADSAVDLLRAEAVAADVPLLAHANVAGRARLHTRVSVSVTCALWPWLATSSGRRIRIDSNRARSPAWR